MAVEVIDITDFNTVQEGFQRLGQLVKLREQEKDTIFYEVWKKDCNRLADKLIKSGVNQRDIQAMIGWTSSTKECYFGMMWN